MRFTAEQRFPTTSPAEVDAAFADPALYAAYPDGDRLAAPEVVAHRVDGHVVELLLRYRFTGELSSAVRAVVDPAGSVVLDYCTATRGILNDDQGGPLHPPGLRMAEELNEVEESLQRNLGAKRGGSPRSSSAGSRDASRRAWTKSRSSRR